MKERNHSMYAFVSFLLSHRQISTVSSLQSEFSNSRRIQT